MIVILGFDGLEYNYVKEFNCKNIMQETFGKTDISEFKEPRTIVLWSSFLAGKNLEDEILGGSNLWDFRLDTNRTFFSKFKKYVAIDVPGFSFIKERHEAERKALKDFFNQKCTVEEYDKIAFENHRKVKQEFFEALKGDYDIVMGYFGLADVIGHLSFGIKPKMKLVYEELDRIAAKVRENIKDKILILSDHGMKPIGRFGDHSNYGFWSVNLHKDVFNPKLTQLFKLILE